MVTLKRSNEYTRIALKSFFDCTELEKDDDFFLIDNDNSTNNQFSEYKKITLIKNDRPLAFSENVNQTIDIALKNKKNIVFLNNDIVFTKKWFEPLLSQSNSISIPSNNQLFQYNSDLEILKLKPTMNLEDFNNNYDLLNDILLEHKKKIKSGQKFQTLLMPFYCFKIPYLIIKDVGYFDKSFGLGGGEDIDYRIRSIIKGYNVSYLTDSYLLHFHGKSTWGIETIEETNKRNNRYKEVFEKKWGKELTQIFISRKNFSEILEKKDLVTLHRENKYSELIKKLTF